MTNQNHHRIQLSILIALMITAVVLLAGGFSGLRLKSGEPIHLLDWILAQLASQNLGELPEYEIETGGSGIWYQLNSTLRGSIIVIFWLILSFSLIYAIISPEFRRELVRVFFLLLTLAVLLPYIARRITEQVNPTEGEMTSGEVPIEGAQFPEPPLFVQQPPEWIFWVAKAVLILLLFTGIYMLWRYLRPKPDPQAVVARHVKKALSELESGNVLEDVVIACYHEVCQELQKNRHLHRQRYMTPREFENFLADQGISDMHITRLTRLFEGARYGGEKSDSSAESLARQDLQAILDAYGE